MKKFLFIAALGIFVMAGLASCKKCSTCTATKTGETTYEGIETCGAKSVIDDYEAAFKSSWEPLGYTVVCE